MKSISLGPLLRLQGKVCPWFMICNLLDVALCLFPPALIVPCVKSLEARLSGRGLAVSTWGVAIDAAQFAK